MLLAAAVGLGAMVVGRMGKPADRRVEEVEHVVPGPGGRGTVALDLSHGRFRVEAVEAGRPLRLAVDYDAAAFELEERLVAGDGPEAGRWRWEIRFGPRRGWFAALGHEARNTVRLELPRGAAFRLEGEIDTGKSALRLGGLELESLDLALRTGEHEVVFDEPLSAPLEALDLIGNAGSLRIDRLGNASPPRARVEHRLGALVLDLRGAWRGDAVVTVVQQLGDLRVQAPEPDEAAVRVVRADVSIGDRDVPADLLGPARAAPAAGAGAAGPTVRFDARVRFGNLALRR